MRSAQGLDERGVLVERGDRLEPIGTVVAVEHGDRTRRDGALEVALQEVMRFSLALSELHHAREFHLGGLVGFLGFLALCQLVEGDAKFIEFVAAAWR